MTGSQESEEFDADDEGDESVDDDGLDVDRVINLHLRQDRGGQEARAGFPVDDAKQAARWLHRNAIKMYPASRYAWQHSGRFSVVALLACLWRPF
jgi:hypothetical protein